MIEPGQAVFLFVFAAAVGTYGTLVGAGGGFLIVPMLLLIFDTPFQIAVGTSLLVVFFNAVSGTLSYARQKRVDYKTAFRFAAATLPGAIVGAYLAELFAGRFFIILFGCLLVLLAIFMSLKPREARLAALEDIDAALPLKAWHTRRHLVDATGQRYYYTYHEPGGLLLSVGVGFLSSTFGIGGGIIHVPALVYLFAFPTHVATATSMFILMVSALVGSVSHILLGNVRFEFAFVMAVGVIAGAQLGARVSKRLRGPWIVRLLALALVVGGFRLILRGLQLS